NLVANPSFEIDSNGDGLADSWTVSGAGITWSASRRSAYDQWSTGFSIEEFDLAVPLPEKPVVIGLFLANNEPLAGSSIGVYYAYYYYWDPSINANRGINFGAWVACDGQKIKIYNGFSFPITVRYYVFREEAFA